MDAIPTYTLYGEYSDDSGLDWVHCETIQSRSRLHNYVIQPHRHERLFQVLSLTGGSAEIMLDGRHIALEAPCIVTLPPMVVHGYKFSSDVNGIVLTFFAQRLEPILAAAGSILTSFQSARILPLSQRPDIARAIVADIDDIVAEFKGRSPGRLAVIEARLALILIALHRALDITGQTGVEARDRALHHVMRFRQLVDQEYRSHKPVDAYARKLGLTATHLNRLCREHLNETALGVIHQRIVLEAKRYLTFTSLSAKEVALTLAFDDPSYFTRFFKRQTGLSPMEFRKAQK